MLEKGILSSGKGVQRAWGEQKGLKPEEHVWRWGEMGRQEAQGQVLRALESHDEESPSGQPSGTLLWRGASFLSWEAISPRRETWSEQAQPTGRQLQERRLQRRATRWLREKTAQRLLLPLLTPFLAKVEKHFFPPSKSFLNKQSLCLFFFLNKRNEE